MKLFDDIIKKKLKTSNFSLVNNLQIKKGNFIVSQLYILLKHTHLLYLQIRCKIKLM